jgi:hypothetical protein
VETYIEQYQAKHGGVTLHIWREREGRKEGNYYITGVAGTPVAAWFREKLRQNYLADIADFPQRPSAC